MDCQNTKELHSVLRRLRFKNLAFIAAVFYLLSPIRIYAKSDFSTLVNHAPCEQSTLDAMQALATSTHIEKALMLKRLKCGLTDNVNLKQIQNAPNSVSGEDTTAPEFVDVALSTDIVDVTDESQLVTITVTFYEAESQMGWASVTLAAPDGFPDNQNRRAYFSQWVEGEEAGSWTSSSELLFSNTDPAGEWPLIIDYSYDSEDNANWDDIHSEDFDDNVTSRSLTVINPYEIDVTAPELESISITPTEIDVTYDSQAVDVVISVRDAGTGILNASYALTPPQGVPSSRSISVFKSMGDIVQDPEDEDLHHITERLVFDHNAPPGEWSMTLYYFADTNNNSIEYTTDNELVELGFWPYINIANNNENIDLSPPAIQSVEFSSNTIDTSAGNVAITAEITALEDNSMGSARFVLGYDNSCAADTYKSVYVSENDWRKTGDNTYSATVTINFDSNDSPGTWWYGAESVTDALGNSSGFQGAYTIERQSGNDMPALLVNIEPEAATDFGIAMKNSVNRARTGLGETGEVTYTVSVANLAIDDSTANSSVFGFGMSDGLVFSSISVSSNSNSASSCDISSTTTGTCLLDLTNNENADITVRYKVVSNAQKAILAVVQPGYGRAGEIEYSNNIARFYVDTPNFPATRADFFGDGAAELALRRTDSGFRTVYNLTTENTLSETFGRATDTPVQGDFDGDGIADLAVWRASNLTWYIKRSSDGNTDVIEFGASQSNTPVPADYDGDGITDLAYRTADGHWFIQNSRNGAVWNKRFGLQVNDIPVPADYDGDGSADIAIRRPENGIWYILQSSDGNLRQVRFGLRPDDVVVPADYDGDGKTDIAVRRLTDKTWFILNSSDSSIRRLRFGLDTTDIPVVSDYDNDGLADVSVFRPTNNYWYIYMSSNEEIVVQPFGDITVPYLPQLTPPNMPLDMSIPATDSEETDLAGFEDTVIFNSPEYVFDRL